MSGKLVKVAQIGCLSVLALVVAVPIIFLASLEARAKQERLLDRTCERADPVRVRLRTTVYAVPAGLQPEFGPEYPGKRMRMPDGPPYSSHYAYCPGSRGPVVQRSILLDEPSEHALPGWDENLAPALQPVRIFHIDAAGSGTQAVPAEGDASEPRIFGRPTVYRCWDGYYGPGMTCRYDGWTPDGSRISIQMHPKPSDADRDRALRAVETVVEQMRETPPAPASTGPEKSDGRTRAVPP